MAMNIGEIRVGSITIPNTTSGVIETTVEWQAERTSATTTVITTEVYHKIIGTISGSSYNSFYSADTTTVNGAAMWARSDSVTIKEINQSKLISMPMIFNTITHSTSGIESFDLSINGTIYGDSEKTYSLNQVVNLSSGKTAKILESNSSLACIGFKVSTKLVYTVDQSTTDNYSDVTAKLYFKMEEGYSGGDSSYFRINNGYITINGVKTDYTYSYFDNVTLAHNGQVGTSTETPQTGVNIPLGTATTRIYHEIDGTKNININSTVKDTYLGNFTINSNETLPTIPRAAIILTAPNFTDEDNPTITYSNPAGTTVTTLQAAISLDGTTATIGWRDISKTGTSYTFNLTDDERNTLRAVAANAATIQVAFLLKTVIGSNTSIESAQRTLSIVSCNPVLDSTVVDTNATTIALTGDANKLVKFYSNAQASLNVTLVKGSTLSYFEIKNGSNYGNAQVFTFNKVENNKFEFLARDSRGNIATKTVTPTMVEYVKLTCNLDNRLPDTSGNYDIRVTGNYFSGSFGAVSNTLTVQYRFKEDGGTYGGWTTLSHTLSDGTYEATTRVTGLDYRKTYVVQIRATDKLADIQTSERKIKTTPQFSWSKDDFEFNTDVRITGDLRLKGDGNYGNTLYFGDGSYSYITEATDDDLTIHSTDLTLEATNLYLNGTSQVKINGATLPNIETGTWDAVLGSSAAVSSYNSRQGWYIKIGNVVTIGWNVDVTCNSGYQSTAIKIAGAPYYPSVSASGGGILYGAYTTGGLAFEGWVIEENGGAITPRLQPCNNTAAANLNISSTAYYPSGGGNLKCFGSITYMTND